MVKLVNKLLGRCAKLGAGMMMKVNGKMSYHQHECNFYKDHEGTDHRCYCGYSWRAK